ncbi:unnamed protein product [Didymodactylos carnosus]|uniref:Lysine-specific metallo-endopeptidase domain-containing protein n=1 Tax=Didymodactylos carnosus TaxID=1234261 RepID=A0A8S2EL25_9BILA|nr:unnamed protein product [Didymodactylos carnosus]CAF4044967.1 unnamed protein product [Didymodactylos carnosus]
MIGSKSTELIILALICAATVVSGKSVPLSDEVDGGGNNGTGGGLSVSLTITSTSNATKEGDDVQVNLHISNAGETTLYIYQIAVPSNGIMLIPLFHLTLHGKKVSYVGPRFKLSAAAVYATIALAPGENLNFIVSLSPYYDLRASGPYKIRYQQFADRVLKTQSAAAKATIVSNILTLQLNGVSNAVLKEADRRRLLLSAKKENGAGKAESPQITFNDECTDKQKTTIAAAIAQAKEYTKDTQSFLANDILKEKKERFTKWFGIAEGGSERSSAIQEEHYSAIADHFIKVKDVLHNQPQKYFCRVVNLDQCTSGTFAYVYPDMPYEYNLCTTFFEAEVAGTDSQGGALIHETTHFLLVAGTDDVADTGDNAATYGKEKCEQLAKKNPTLAVQNADNNEYFAENSP